MTRTILCIVVSTLPLACKPRIDDSSHVKAEIGAESSAFEVLLGRIDVTSEAVASDLLAGETGSARSVEGLALLGEVNLESTVNQAIELILGLMERPDLTETNRDLLESLRRDLGQVLESEPSLSDAQRQAAAAVVAEAGRRLGAKGLPAPAGAEDRPNPAGTAVSKLSLVMSVHAACFSPGDGVTCWGDSAIEDPPKLKNVTKLQVARTVACAIADGKAQCWGSNSSAKSFNDFDVRDIALARHQPAKEQDPSFCVLVANGNILCT